MLTRIYCSEEQRERASKALRINGGPDYDYDPRLLAASSISRSKRPTIRIKRLKYGGTKLRAASTLQRQLLEQEKMKAEKALRLNCGI